MVERCVSHRILSKTASQWVSSQSRAPLFISSRPKCPFSTSIRCLGASQPRATPTPKKAESASKPLMVTPASYKTFADTLAIRSSPTLLYLASSHTLYITGCYVVGGLCIATAGVNFYTQYLHPGEDVPVWIPVVMGGFCVLMAFVGTRVILGSYRLIHSITAVPPSSRGGPRTLLLQIENSAMLPGIRPSSILVPYSDVGLSSPIQKVREILTAAELAQRRAQEAKEHHIDMSYILTLPFRQISFWIRRGFKKILPAMRRVWNKEGFAYVKIKGRNGTWKLDKDKAWALDNGRTLDRLLNQKL